MAEKWNGIIRSGIVSYATTILLMMACLFMLRKRAVKNPGIKFFGMSVKTISIIIYVGIYIDAFVIVMELVK